MVQWDDQACVSAGGSAGSWRASVRISAVGSYVVRPTYVFQLKYADVLRAREIRMRRKSLALLPTDFDIQRFRAQSRTCVKPERREDPDRRSDVEMYGPLGRGL